MILTFDFMTFNVLVNRLSRDQTMYHILEKPKSSWWNSPEAFFMRGLARNHLWRYNPFLDPMAEFKLFMPSALAPQCLASWFQYSLPTP